MVGEMPERPLKSRLKAYGKRISKPTTESSQGAAKDDDVHHEPDSASKADMGSSNMGSSQPLNEPEAPASEYTSKGLRKEIDNPVIPYFERQREAVPELNVPELEQPRQFRGKSGDVSKVSDEAEESKEAKQPEESEQPEKAKGREKSEQSDEAEREEIDAVGTIAPRRTFAASHLLDLRLLFQGIVKAAELLELIERPPGLGFKRIRWTCVCGSKLCDDFKELSPGALE